jgi:hypothetical protein
MIGRLWPFTGKASSIRIRRLPVGAIEKAERKDLVDVL